MGQHGSATEDQRDRPWPLHDPADERQRAALGAAVAVARSGGNDGAGAGVWRAGSAVLIGLPEVPALARVDDPFRADDAVRQVRVAEVLSERGVRAVRLTGPQPQPVLTEAGPVTVWAWVPPVGSPITPRDVGEAARELHDRTRSLTSEQWVPAHEPLVATRAELVRSRAAGTTDPVDLDRLVAVADRLAVTWPAPEDDPLGAAVVHGDLHRSNLVAARRGPVLADLELAGWGPASADLAPAAVAVSRYGAAPEMLEDVVAGYGADPREWSGFDVLVEAYELWVTAWAVANRSASPHAEREAEVRLERWRTGSSPQWTLR